LIYQSITVTFDASGEPVTSPASLRSIELATGKQTLLASGENKSYSASISNDGSVVLYLAAPGPSQPVQAFVSRPDGSGRRQLTSAPDGITEAVLSGLGNLAYAVTGAGRLLSVDVAGGNAREIIPRTPLINGILGIYTIAAPGSLIWIKDTGLSETAQWSTGALPQSLGGAQVKIGGELQHLLLVSPNEIRQQIPFDAPTGAQTVEILPSASPFEQAYQVGLSAASPHFLRWGTEVEPAVPGNFQEVMAHGDFSGLVTQASPAKPGELIHFYMTGLGAVAPPVAVGQPAPANPPTRAIAPLICTNLAESPAESVDVRLAGLAPGFFGIYQVSIRVPKNIRPLDFAPGLGVANVYCSAGSQQPADAAGVPVALSGTP
jgi:uncharacterized protein (TIGR03437 family)